MLDQYTPAQVASIQELAARLNLIFVSNPEYHGKYDGLLPPDQNGKRDMIRATYPEGPVTDWHWQCHIRPDQERKLGLTGLLPDLTTFWICIDEDDYTTPNLVEQRAREVRAAGIPAFVTRSKSGGPRIWVCFKAATPIGQAHELADLIKRRLGMHPKTEVFPKIPNEGRQQVWLVAPYADGDQGGMCLYVSISDNEPVRPVPLVEAIEIFEASRIEDREIRGQISHLRILETAPPTKATTIDPLQRTRAIAHLDHACEQLRTATEFRDNITNQIVWWVGRYVGGDLLDFSEAHSKLLAAALQNPNKLTEDRLRYMINRSLSQGTKMPLKEIDTPQTRSRKPEAPIPVEAIITTLADVEDQVMDWLWPNRFPKGLLSILAGDPGDGKSQIELLMASLVSTGSIWPDGSGCAPQGHTIILSNEDPIKEAIGPRFTLSKGDRRYCHVLEGVRTTDDSIVAFNIHDHINLLEAAMDNIEVQGGTVQLIGVDPLDAYLGRSLNAVRSNEYRSTLVPLQQLASRRHVAVVVIAHNTKGNAGVKQIMRILNSIALVGLGRAAWGIIREADIQGQDDDPSDRFLLLSLKNQYAPLGNGLAYRIVPGEHPTNPDIKMSRVVFDPEIIQMTMEDAANMARTIAKEREQKDPGKLTEAISWVRKNLDRDTPSKEMEARGKAAGFSVRTLGRAKREWGIKSSRSPDDGTFSWVRPELWNTEDLEKAALNDSLPF